MCTYVCVCMYVCMCKTVIPDQRYAYPQRYEAGHLGIREKKLMAGKGSYVKRVKPDTSQKLWN